MVVGYSAKSCVSFKIFLNLFLWLLSIAWIGSLAMGITYMAAPIATSLCDRWGCRVVMCLGSVTYMAAMLLTSVVQHMSLMYITYGVLFGFASSCCYFSSFYILIVYFNKHLALANGIAAAGAGAGTMSLSLTVDKLIASYGLRMTFKGLAALSVCLFLAGLTFLPIDFREGEDELLKREALLKEQEEIRIKDRLVKNIKELFKPAPVWGNKPFVAWTVALAMVLIAYYIPYMYLVSSFKLLYTTECLLGLTDGQGDLKPYFTLCFPLPFLALELHWRTMQQGTYFFLRRPRLGREPSGIWVLGLRSSSIAAPIRFLKCPEIHRYMSYFLI